ncbi:hypothetical protein [Halochromatium glycolicum]|jgi:hypothetical protein|uniref:Uncharacterized protein n=1 Tax=Halochromatium glycolicum TaxID=85075 RepID=A0AAJ0X8U7_9GAMM|nr:hypothetical protein [Halochromatium glycolicum]MBK1702982.1 hypothetical protein [Halochromatium glycolicum]
MSWRQPGSTYTALALALLLALTASGCRDAAESGGEKTEKGPAGGAVALKPDVPDPAMAVMLDEAASRAPHVAAKPPAVPAEPTRFTVDTDAGRVFLPSQGWRTVDEFRDLYYSRPQDLPGDIDHDAVMALWQQSDR